MASDVDQKLDEINQKLQVMKENSFLTRLDMMFSVLVSITFFGVGLLLANYRAAQNVFYGCLTAFFATLIYTLAGEAYAILKDDVTLRFAFWLVFVSGLSFLAVALLFSTMIFVFGVPNVILFPLAYVLAQGIVVGVLRRYTRFFWSYLKHFQTRFENPQEHLGIETQRLLRPAMFGVVIYIVAFVLITAFSILFLA